jgi:streptogramin lyase
LNDMQKARGLNALLAIAVTFIAFDGRLAAEELKAIEVPGDRAFTESITAGPDGTLYLSSLASGGIARVKPGASKAEAWIAPGAFESRSTFGVFADATSNTLWVCSNDVSSLGVAGPGSATGSDLVAWRLCEACLDVEAASIMLFE